MTPAVRPHVATEHEMITFSAERMRRTLVEVASARLGAYISSMPLDALTRWLPFGAVPEIHARNLAARLADEGESPLLLDVRTTTEHARSRIPGARSVPIHTLAARMDALALSPGDEVVVICLSAHRSIPAVRLLRERGVEAVQLEGGMRAWWSAALPTESD